MQGLHLTADLTDCACEPAWLTDAPRLLAFCVQAVRAAGLQAVNQLAHGFPPTEQGPGGVTASVRVAEHHLGRQAVPEHAGSDVDVYVCNFGADHSAKAQQLLDAMVTLFSPRHSLRQALQRGALAAV